MKILKISCYVISFLLIAWVAFSYIDIVADNCFPNPVHYEWNLFMLMKGWGR